jgi:hypothetical protein
MHVVISSWARGGRSASAQVGTGTALAGHKCICTAAIYSLILTTSMCLWAPNTTKSPPSSSEESSIQTLDPRDGPDGNVSTIVVHDYYGNNVPPHPGQGWTRFVCVSDTHSKTFPLPDGDVLIHAGDLCSWGTVKQLQVTMDWLVALPHPKKM